MASVIEIGRESYSPVTAKNRASTPTAIPRQHLGTTQLTLLDGEILDELYFFATVPNIEVNVQAMVEVHFHGYTENRRAIEMRTLFDVNLHDVAVMVGLGCFTGSAASVVWELASTSPAPTAFIIPVAVAGFAWGRLVSVRSDRHSHATNS